MYLKYFEKNECDYTYSYGLSYYLKSCEKVNHITPVIFAHTFLI